MVQASSGLGNLAKNMIIFSRLINERSHGMLFGRVLWCASPKLTSCCRVGLLDQSLMNHHSSISRSVLLQDVARTPCAFLFTLDCNPHCLRTALESPRVALRTCRIIGLVGVTLLCHFTSVHRSNCK